MFQGTGSSVGKSILAAGFCRILKQDHIRVVPFKAQNMALNAFVTEEGLEMGRAQVVQAEAAGLKPSVKMNPILLKPTSDTGSQVIVHGKVVNNMDAKSYHAHKPYLKEAILSSFADLEAQFQAIVIEGAGSPAEINLRENDIVNMGFAQMVDSKVILIADIDKGGVFASLYGTYMLLSEEERSRICGYIINKFRGDEKLLQPGIEMMKEKMPLTCLGVMPYIILQIDDEDSVTERFRRKKEGKIKLGVVRLPYISNFTDFAPLEMEPSLAVSYMTRPEEVKEQDIIILPGSKNTLYDMKFLQESNMGAEIIRANKRGVKVVGICGGFQMLGREIYDEEGTESTMTHMNGLGLLPITTHMAKEKTTLQTKGKLYGKNQMVGQKDLDNLWGYEIHMGQTIFQDESLKPFIQTDRGTFDGAYDAKKKIFGTYMHGIFDNDGFRNAFVNELLLEKGYQEEETWSLEAFKEKEYDNLAETMRKHLDIQAIYREMGLKP